MTLTVDEKKKLKRQCTKAIEIRKNRHDATNQEVAKYCRPIRTNWSDEGPATAAFGTHGYIVNPSVRWYRHTPTNRALEKSKAISVYLQNAEDHLSSQFDRSNFYTAAAELFKDFVSFGQGTMWVGENASRSNIQCVVIHPKRVGLLTNAMGEITGHIVSLWLTKDEMKERFGEAALPKVIKDISTTEDDSTTHYQVLHVVTRRKFSRRGGMASQKPFASYYFYEGDSEVLGDDSGWKLLREGGYNSDPYITCRWDCEAEDPYGIGPGVYALPSFKMLQELEKLKLQSTQINVHRPTIANIKFKGRLNYSPHGVTWKKDGEDDPKTLFDGSSTVDVNEEINRVIEQIHDIFFRRFFTVLMSSDKPMTAFQAGGMQGEQAALLGPIVTRIVSECLIPFLSRAWEIELDAMRLEAPPPELADDDLTIDFLGLLPQLVKRHARVTGTIQALSALQAVAGVFGTRVLDNFDDDIIGTGIADDYGMDQTAIRDKGEVDKIRDQKAKAAQAQANAEMAQALLSNADKVSSLAPMIQSGAMGGGVGL